MKDLPHVAPPADGLRQALADARGRRLRSAGLASTAAAGALLTVAVLTGGAGTQSLVQEPAPEQPAVNRIVPGGPEAPPREDPGISPAARGSAPRRGAAATAVLTPPLTAPGPSDGPGPVSRTSARSPSGYAAGPVERFDNNGVTAPDTRCNLTGDAQDATALCTYAAVSGAPRQLQAQVCSTRTGLTLLHYAGRNEVDLAVHDAKGVEVWRWSRWHPDRASPHTLGLSAGSCTTWSLDWAGVDATGRALPKGDYTLRATFLADELADRRTSTTEFTLS